jgi:hypothetical protein
LVDPTTWPQKNNIVHLWGANADIGPEHKTATTQVGSAR